MIIDDYPEYIIEHYGKKGMKWGSRNVPTNRELNKRSRAKDKKKFVKDVERARTRINTGKTDKEYKKIKAAHADTKAKLGSREARKILNEAKNKRYNESLVASQAKDGKEAAIVIATGVAAGLGYLALSAALRR